jgi:hypothetical protein
LDDSFKQLLAVEQAPKSVEVEEAEEKEEAKAFSAVAGTTFNKDKRMCYYCGEVGHIKPNCPVKAKADMAKLKFPAGGIAL